MDVINVDHVRTCLSLRQEIRQGMAGKNIYFLLSWEDRSAEAKDRDETQKVEMW